MDNMPPTIASWHKLMFEVIPMEYLTYRFKWKMDDFYFFLKRHSTLDVLFKILTTIMLKGVLDGNKENWWTDTFGVWGGIVIVFVIQMYNFLFCLLSI